ncbi:MAG: glucose-6-phosphate dehydrogenase, partial [Deltaproteobacteria bacterium]|nr:glucose-6-phosphate dehydrogenase [Deltaproteobacteria bacterium]
PQRSEDARGPAGTRDPRRRARRQVIIVGASGDLTERKLVPALVSIARSCAEPFGVVGFARRPKTDEQFRAGLAEAIPAELRAAWTDLAPHVHYQQGDVENAEDLAALERRLDALADGEPAGRLFYLALKPDLFASAAERLRAAGLVTRLAAGTDAPFRRVVIEKPFGRDLSSARELLRRLHSVLDEHQLFRIDHYLGKETVQNILGLRFHNAIFEPLWNRHHVELVQITVAEDIGVEGGRAAYYDGAGAMRDMLQNHMLQILALVAMEPPSSLDPEAIRDEKVQALRGLRTLDSTDAAQHSVRARYARGRVGGVEVRGYLEEDGVSPGSQTETFVAVRTEIQSWRWGGVPILLRHGKRLAKRFTEVQVQFRTPPLQLFNRPEGMSDAELGRQLRNGTLCQIRPNILRIAIQPAERITLSFGVKRPGTAMVMTPAELTFDYQSHFGRATPPAYERLLLDAMNGDATLFLRAEEIEASWSFADALLDAWKAPEAPPVEDYEAGSWGPESADRLFQGCEGTWSRG